MTHMGGYSARRISAILGKVGEPVVLVRGASSLAFKGRRVGGVQVEDETGSMAQHRFDVKVAAKPLVDAGWPVPPAADDRLEIAGRKYRVVAVQPADIGGVAQHYILTVAGTQ